MTDASASAVSFHILTHVISSRHEKRLHLSRASIVKYVPAEVRPPPPKFLAERGWPPSRYGGRATEMGEILCGLRHLSLRLE
jgi:hypothetical protein